MCSFGQGSGPSTHKLSGPRDFHKSNEKVEAVGTPFPPSSHDSSIANHCHRVKSSIYMFLPRYNDPADN